MHALHAVDPKDKCQRENAVNVTANVPPRECRRSATNEYRRRACFGESGVGLSRVAMVVAANRRGKGRRGKALWQGALKEARCKRV